MLLTSKITSNSYRRSDIFEDHPVPVTLRRPISWFIWSWLDKIKWYDSVMKNTVHLLHIILKNSPFSNFLVPGIILFLVLGVFPIFTVWALIKKPLVPFATYFNVFKDMHWSWSCSIYCAFALVIWIQVETYFIQGVGWLQMFYMLYAIPMLIVTLLPSIRNRYKLF